MNSIINGDFMDNMKTKENNNKSLEGLIIEYKILYGDQKLYDQIQTNIYDERLSIIEKTTELEIALTEIKDEYNHTMQNIDDDEYIKKLEEDIENLSDKYKVDEEFIERYNKEREERMKLLDKLYETIKSKGGENFINKYEKF